MARAAAIKSFFTRHKRKFMAGAVASGVAGMAGGLYYRRKMKQKQRKLRKWNRWYLSNVSHKDWDKRQAPKGHRYTLTPKLVRRHAVQRRLRPER